MQVLSQAKRCFDPHSKQSYPVSRCVHTSKEEIKRKKRTSYLRAHSDTAKQATAKTSGTALTRPIKEHMAREERRPRAVKAYGIDIKLDLLHVRCRYRTLCFRGTGFSVVGSEV